MRFMHIGFFAVLVTIAPAVAATVPFVGCPTDSLTAPLPAPKGAAIPVPFDAKTAARLAFYKSQVDQGVIGPRGWHCQSFKAFSGWVTIVTPATPSPSTMLRYAKFHPITGPAIQITRFDGLSSGREDIAKLIARYFPERGVFLKFVKSAVPMADYPAGPFPKDQRLAQKRGIVEYLTPAGKEGLGTLYRLVPSDLPIRAFAAVVGPDEALEGYAMGVRLAKDKEDLGPLILSWAEQRYTAGK
jgi:hypothetical protein